VLLVVGVTVAVKLPAGWVAVAVDVAVPVAVKGVWLVVTVTVAVKLPAGSVTVAVDDIVPVAV
jgi:hypothetical protein